MPEHDEDHETPEQRSQRVYKLATAYCRNPAALAIRCDDTAATQPVPDKLVEAVTGESAA